MARRGEDGRGLWLLHGDRHGSFPIRRNLGGSRSGAHDAAASLRLGTLVLNIDLCHPLLIAREAITADVLTDGKIELGLGAGWDVDDYRAMGRERAPASVRVDRLAEAVAIVRQACAGAAPRFSGVHYDASGTDPWPTPSQGRIPILVGGGGEGMRLSSRRSKPTSSASRATSSGG